MARKKKEEFSLPPGTPEPWMATFSDMMTLLMCFFVMLFSMSNVDAAKFDEVAQSFQQTISIFKGGAMAIGDGVLVSNGVSQLNMLDEYINSTGKVAESDSDNLDFEENASGELEEMSKQVEELVELVEKLGMSAEELGELLEKLQKIEAEKGALLEELADKTGASEEEKAELLEAIKELEAEQGLLMEDLADKIGASEDELAELLAALKGMEEDLGASIEELAEKLGMSAEELGKLLESLQEFDAEQGILMEELAGQIGASEEKLAELIAAIEALEEKIGMLSAELAEKLGVNEEDLEALLEALKKLESEKLGANAGDGDSLKEAIETLEHEKMQMSEELAEKIEEALVENFLTEEIDVEFNSNYVVLSLNGAFLFDSGQATLKKEAIPVLKKVGVLLTKYADSVIEIEGHTDSVPLNGGRYENNDVLSSYRALAVFNYLKENTSVDPGVMKHSGRGEYIPVADNSTPEGRAKNRRVEIKIYNSLSTY